MTLVAPTIDGATHVHSGKVRDLYSLPDGRLLIVASDRMSAFDFILDTPIPDKGEILTRMSLWWFDRLAGLVPHHVLSTDVPPEVRGRVMRQANSVFPNQSPGPLTPGGQAQSPPPMCAMYSLSRSDFPNRGWMTLNWACGSRWKAMKKSPAASLPVSGSWPSV